MYVNYTLFARKKCIKSTKIHRKKCYKLTKNRMNNIDIIDKFIRILWQKCQFRIIFIGLHLKKAYEGGVSVNLYELRSFGDQT